MKQAQRMAEMCSEAQGVSWAEDVFPQGWSLALLQPDVV